MPSEVPSRGVLASEQAAEVLGRQPQALQLRYLETLTVIAADKNSTIVFPMPLELMDLLRKAGPK